MPFNLKELSEKPIGKGLDKIKISKLLIGTVVEWNRFEPLTGLGTFLNVISPR